MARGMLYVLIILDVLLFVYSNHFNTSESILELYEKGVQAYLEERYQNCVTDLENSLEKYRVLQRNVQNCRLNCNYESENSEPLYPVDIENLRFYEKTVRTTLCTIKCRRNKMAFTDGDYVKFQTIHEERKPYEYLNICYFKINDIQSAASAAFTFLVSYPDHKIMAKNLKLYSEMPEVNMKELVNFEAKDYVYLYIYGTDAYDKKDWDNVISNMEESLTSYLEAENECRALCEGSYNSQLHLDFVPSISNHFAYVLKCKRKCQEKLINLNGEIYEDLLASHYHYLQYAYFKRGHFEAACKAVASYLMFLPNDKTMLDNMRYYSKQPKVQEGYFVPRKEAVQYMQRDIYERRILQYINSEFNFSKKNNTNSKEK